MFQRKAILFLESEIDLLKLKICYPEQFPQVEQLAFKSMLSLIPKSPNLGIMGMAEILTSLKLLEGIEDEAGDRNIYREYIAFCNYKGKRHAMLLKRRKAEFALLYIP